MRLLRSALVRLTALAALATSLFFSTAAAAAPGAFFTDELATAHRLTADRSWALALEHFDAALAAAPTGADLRPIQLERFAAETEALPLPRNWDERQTLATTRQQQLDAWLAPYGETTPYDDFAVGVVEAGLRFRNRLNLGLDSERFLATAERLATAPVTPANASRLYGFLFRQMGPVDQPQSWPSELTALLDGLAATSAAPPTARAWAAFAAAALRSQSAPPSAEILRAWQQARDLAAPTPVAALTEAGWFLWQCYSGWSPDGAPGEAIDLRARSAEARRLSRALNGAEPALQGQRGKELDRFVREWRQPFVQITTAELYRPDEPLSFGYGATGVGELVFLLYQLPPDQLPAFLDGAPADPAGNGPALARWSVDLGDPATLAWSSDVHQFTPSLAPGFYALVATAGPDHPELKQINHFVVSAVQATVILGSSTDGQSPLYCTDLSSGEPLPHVKVSGRTVDRDGLAMDWSGETDATGRFDGLRFPPRTQPRDWNQMVIVGTAHDQPFLLRANVPTPRPTIVADLMLDRPLYRPGDTVHWKLTLREPSQGTWHIPTTPWTVRFSTENDDDFFTLKNAPLSDFGALQGEFPLPTDLNPTGLSLKVFGTDPERPVYQQQVAAVDNYVPPALAADLTYAGAPNDLRPGGVLTARLSARFLSGGPAQNATVSLAILPSAPPVPYDALRRGRVTSDRPAPPEPQGLKARTDAAGNATFRWTIPADLPADSRLSLLAQVQPTGGQAVTATAEWPISASGYNVDLDLPAAAQLTVPAQPLTITGRVRNNAGQPVAWHGLAEWLQTAWHGLYLNPAGAIVDETQLPADLTTDDLPEGWQIIHEGYLEHLVTRLPIDTGADGAFTCEVTPPTSGFYRLRFVDTESRELSPAPASSPRFDVTDPFQFVVADATTTALPFPRNRNALFCPAQVTQGKPFAALLIRPNARTPGWLTLARPTSFTTRPLPAGSRLTWFDLSPVGQTTGPGRLSMMGSNQRFYSQQDFTIAPAAPPLRLTVDWPGTARPGETVDARFQTTDAQGSPVATEIAVAVADQAVLQLVNRSAEPPDPFNHFDRVPDVRIETSPALARDAPTSPVDPRRGTVIRAIGGSPGANATDFDEVVVLSPFSVNTGESMGYSTALSARSGTGLKVNGARAKTGVPSFQLRQHFASTAAWIPDLHTGADGTADYRFTLPDNLTSWALSAYALGADGNRFAGAAAFLQSSLPFQARLQPPRFLIAGDRAEIGVTLLNQTPAAAAAQVAFQVDGAATLVPPAPSTQSTDLPAQGEAQLHWTVRADSLGSTTLTTHAQTTANTDAMSVSLPVREDGIDQTTATSLRLAPAQTTGALTLPLPTPLDPARTVATLTLSTTPAVSVFDAIPYLVDYPYGCVEQTVSRFLPAVVVRQTLTSLGLSAAAIEARILPLESPADQKRRAAQAGLSRLDEVVAQSLSRLQAAQLSDGGFGWWPDADDADPWMTAYVGWALSLAQASGIDVPADLLEATQEHCADIAADPDQSIDARVWALLANGPKDADANTTLAHELFLQRGDLSAAGRATLALCLARDGSPADRATILDNLQNEMVRTRDAAGELLHWGATIDCWRALDGANEATALTILALLELAPDSPLIEPAVNWLALNRASAHWDSTRDTTFAVLALTRFLARAASANESATVALSLNGHPLESVRLSNSDLLAQPISRPLPIAAVQAGPNQLQLMRRQGTAPLYTTALATAWATGDAVLPAGHLATVSRAFERQRPVPTLSGIVRIEPALQGPHGTVAAGEQVMARVTVTVPHDLRYVLIKVPKPAGCEPLNPLSGWDATIARASDASTPADDATASRPLYREEHDDHSAFFISTLDAGTWEVVFPLRAVTPGDFRALPVQVEAMYVPSIRANSDAQRLKVSAE